MAKDITEKKTEDLVKEVLEKRTELREKRFNVTGTKAKDVKEERKIKRSIARMLTELRARVK